MKKLLSDYALRLARLVCVAVIAVLGLSLGANAATTQITPTVSPDPSTIGVGDWWPTDISVSWGNQELSVNPDSPYSNGSGIIINIPITINGQPVPDEWIPGQNTTLTAQPAVLVDEGSYTWWDTEVESAPTIFFGGFPGLYSAPQEGESMEITLPAGCLLIGDSGDTNAELKITYNFGEVDYDDTDVKTFGSDVYCDGTGTFTCQFKTRLNDPAPMSIRSNVKVDLAQYISLVLPPQIDGGQPTEQKFETILMPDGTYAYNFRTVHYEQLTFTYTGNTAVTFTFSSEVAEGQQMSGLADGGALTMGVPKTIEQNHSYSLTLDEDIKGDFYIMIDKNVNVLQNGTLRVLNAFETELLGDAWKTGTGTSKTFNLITANNGTYGYTGPLTLNAQTIYFYYTGSQTLQLTVGQGEFTENGVPSYMAAATVQPTTIGSSDATAQVQISWKGQKVTVRNAELTMPYTDPSMLTGTSLNVNEVISIQGVESSDPDATIGTGDSGTVLLFNMGTFAEDGTTIPAGPYNITIPPGFVVNESGELNAEQTFTVQVVDDSNAVYEINGGNIFQGGSVPKALDREDNVLSLTNVAVTPAAFYIQKKVGDQVLAYYKAPSQDNNANQITALGEYAGGKYYVSTEGYDWILSANQGVGAAGTVVDITYDLTTNTLTWAKHEESSSSIEPTVEPDPSVPISEGEDFPGWSEILVSWGDNTITTNTESPYFSEDWGSIAGIEFTINGQPFDPWGEGAETLRAYPVEYVSGSWGGGYEAADSGQYISFSCSSFIEQTPKLGDYLEITLPAGCFNIGDTGMTNDALTIRYTVGEDNYDDADVKTFGSVVEFQGPNSCQFSTRLKEMTEMSIRTDSKEDISEFISLVFKGTEAQYDQSYSFVAVLMEDGNYAYNFKQVTYNEMTFTYTGQATVTFTFSAEPAEGEQMTGLKDGGALTLGEPKTIQPNYVYTLTFDEPTEGDFYIMIDKDVNVMQDNTLVVQNKGDMILTEGWKVSNQYNLIAATDGTFGYTGTLNINNPQTIYFYYTGTEELTLQVGLGEFTDAGAPTFMDPATYQPQIVGLSDTGTQIFITWGDQEVEMRNYDWTLPYEIPGQTDNAAGIEVRERMHFYGDSKENEDEEDTSTIANGDKGQILVFDFGGAFPDKVVGDYSITIPAGLVKNSDGALNPTQKFTVQVIDDDDAVYSVVGAIFADNSQSMEMDQEGTILTLENFLTQAQTFHIEKKVGDQVLAYYKAPSNADAANEIIQFGEFAGAAYYISTEGYDWVLSAAAIGDNGTYVDMAYDLSTNTLVVEKHMAGTYLPDATLMFPASNTITNKPGQVVLMWDQSVEANGTLEVTLNAPGVTNQKVAAVLEDNEPDNDDGDGAGTTYIYPTLEFNLGDYVNNTTYNYGTWTVSVPEGIVVAEDGSINPAQEIVFNWYKANEDFEITPTFGNINSEPAYNPEKLANVLITWDGISAVARNESVKGAMAMLNGSAGTDIDDKITVENDALKVDLSSLAPGTYKLYIPAAYVLLTPSSGSAQQVNYEISTYNNWFSVSNGMEQGIVQAPFEPTDDGYPTVSGDVTYVDVAWPGETLTLTNEGTVTINPDEWNTASGVAVTDLSIVDNSTLRITFGGLSLDPGTFWSPTRVIDIPEGIVENAYGDKNPAQKIIFNVENLYDGAAVWTPETGSTINLNEENINLTWEGAIYASSTEEVFAYLEDSQNKQTTLKPYHETWEPNGQIVSGETGVTFDFSKMNLAQGDYKIVVPKGTFNIENEDGVMALNQETEYSFTYSTAAPMEVTLQFTGVENGWQHITLANSKIWSSNGGPMAVPSNPYTYNFGEDGVSLTVAVESGYDYTYTFTTDAPEEVYDYQVTGGTESAIKTMAIDFLTGCEGYTFTFNVVAPTVPEPANYTATLNFTGVADAYQYVDVYDDDNYRDLELTSDTYAYEYKNNTANQYKELRFSLSDNAPAGATLEITCDQATSTDPRNYTITQYGTYTYLDLYNGADGYTFDVKVTVPAPAQEVTLEFTGAENGWEHITLANSKIWSSNGGPMAVPSNPYTYNFGEDGVSLTVAVQSGYDYTYTFTTDAPEEAYDYQVTGGTESAIKTMAIDFLDGCEGYTFTFNVVAPTVPEPANYTATLNFTGVADAYQYVDVYDDDNYRDLELTSDTYAYEYKNNTANQYKELRFSLSDNAPAGATLEITCDQATSTDPRNYTITQYGTYTYLDLYNGAGGYTFDVKVTVPAADVPEFVSVYPANYEVVTLNDDGTLDVTLTFTEAVDAVTGTILNEYVYDGTPVAGQDNKVWNLTIGALGVEESLAGYGEIWINVQATYGNGQYVVFDPEAYEEYQTTLYLQYVCNTQVQDEGVDFEVSISENDQLTAPVTGFRVEGLNGENIVANDYTNDWNGDGEWTNPYASIKVLQIIDLVTEADPDVEFDGNVTFKTPITEPGQYTLIIPYAAFTLETEGVGEGNDSRYSMYKFINFEVLAGSVTPSEYLPLATVETNDGIPAGSTVTNLDLGQVNFLWNNLSVADMEPGVPVKLPSSSASVTVNGQTPIFGVASVWMASTQTTNEQNGGTDILAGPFKIRIDIDSFLWSYPVGSEVKITLNEGLFTTTDGKTNQAQTATFYLGNKVIDDQYVPVWTPEDSSFEPGTVEAYVAWPLGPVTAINGTVYYQMEDAEGVNGALTVVPSDKVTITDAGQLKIDLTSLTEPGRYSIVVNQGVVTITDTDNNEDYANIETFYNFTILGEDEPDVPVVPTLPAATSNPEDNYVGNWLNDIAVNWEGVNISKADNWEGISVVRDGEDVIAVTLGLADVNYEGGGDVPAPFDEDGEGEVEDEVANTLTVSFDDFITTPGVYVLNIPAGAVQLFVDGGWYDNEQVSFTYTVTALGEPTTVEPTITIDDNSIVMAWGEYEAEITSNFELYLTDAEGNTTVVVAGDDAVYINEDGALVIDLDELDLPDGEYTLTLVAQSVNIDEDGTITYNNQVDFNFEIKDGQTSAITLVGSDKLIRVYNLNGVNVLNTDNEAELQLLDGGIYIINGKKVLIRK